MFFPQHKQATIENNTHSEILYLYYFRALSLFVDIFVIFYVLYPLSRTRENKHAVSVPTA